MYLYNEFNVGDVVNHKKAKKNEFLVIDILYTQPEKKGEYLYCCKLLEEKENSKIFKYIERDLRFIRKLFKDASSPPLHELARQEELIIAIHEAAHAGLCLSQKIPFEKVSIIQGENYLGKLVYSREFLLKFQDESLLSENRKFLLFRKYIMCVLAGFVAENKINSTSSITHAEQDHIHAFEQCGHFFGNIKTAQAFLDYMICEVENMFTFLIDEEENETEDTELWKFVISLSERLLAKKELSYKECKQTYKSFPNI